MKYTKTCPCCDHVVAAYTYRLNAGLVAILKRLVRFYETNRRRAPREDLELTNVQYSTIAHLCYFGLAHSDENGYVPTRLGTDFVHGNARCQDEAAIMEGEVLPLDHEAWGRHPRTPQFITIDDCLPTEYKQRSEYQEEKGSKYPTLFNATT